MRIRPKVAVGVVYVTVMFVTMMDTTVVNVALPSIARSMNVEATEVDIAVVGFLVFLGLAMPASGWLSERFGRKSVFLTGLVGFTVASLLCSLATDLVSLTVYRMLQGAAGGVLMPVGLSMYLHAYPPSERVRANRIMMVPMVVAPASGPIIGGLLVDALSWNWIFLVNIPIAFVALVFGLVYIRREPATAPPPLDLPGFLTASLGVGGLMYGLAVGATRGWTSPDVLIATLGGLAFLTCHVWVELRATHPLLDLRLLKNRFLSRTVLVLIASYLGFSGLLFVVPVLLQDARHSTGLEAGLATFPEAIGVAISTQIAAKLMKRCGPRVLMIVGQSLAAVVVVVLMVIIPVVPVAGVSLCMLLLGGSMAYTMLPSQTIAFATIEPGQNSSASTLWSLIMQLSAAAGVALLSTAISTGRTIESSVEGVRPYQVALGCGAALLAVAAVVAGGIPRRDEALAAIREGEPVLDYKANAR